MKDVAHAKIEDVIGRMNDDEEVDVEGFRIPVAALRGLMGRGYVHLKPYRENRTVTFWGKSCSACFTEKSLREMA